MKLCWIINRALLLSLILMNLEIPVAESIEFPSGLRVGETGCAGGATDKWEIGFPVLTAARRYGAGSRWDRLRPSHRKSVRSRSSIPCRQLRLLQGAQTGYSDRPR